MFTTYLFYEPLDDKLSSHAHLMQRQAIAATVRAVLSEPREKGEGAMTTRLLVSAHPAVLSIATAIAADFSAFSEPEGEERHQPPLAAILDGTEKGAQLKGYDGPPSFEPWIHPARIAPPLSLQDALWKYTPSVFIITGDPRRFFTYTMREMGGWFAENRPKVIFFRKFMRKMPDFIPDTGATLIDAEEVLKERLEFSRSESISPFEAAFEKGEELDLEPFFPYGTAIEHAIWGHRTE